MTSAHLNRRKHVAPDLPESRLEDGWQTIAAEISWQAERRRQKARRRILAGGGAGLLAAAAAIAFVLIPAEEPASPWAGTTLRSGAEPLEVTLADGSLIAAEPETQIELQQADDPSTLGLALVRGEATFEVTRNERRTFMVQAGAVQVRVIGTRFRVLREGNDRVEVSVERGVVEVTHSRGSPIRLSAGERWSVDLLAAQEETADNQANPAEVSATAVERSPRRRAREQLDPAALFEEATQLRSAGRAREAARAYAAFLQREPSGGRASLAAFELGRLRMDRLSDAGGAAQAFQHALRIAPRSAFRQETLARLVRLYDRPATERACTRWKAAYLREFAGGRYAGDVQQRCGAEPTPQ
ncbi:MAG: FecR family protein [Myxococcota bacterium]